VEYHIDNPNAGVKVYWQTNDTYNIGDNVEGYRAITIAQRLPNTYKPKSFKLLPLVVNRKKTTYIVSEFTSDEADIECLEIIDINGKLVDFDGAVVTNEWIPIQDWGNTCVEIDWEKEYLKIVKPQVER
jgi:hypothetical protein